MIISISAKNINTSDRLKDLIESKFSKLDKYFSNDVEAKVTLSQEKDRQKMEVTINTNGAIFRAEDTTQDLYTGVDRVVDKLSGQISKHKSKIIRKHKDNKSIRFEGIPDVAGDETEHFEIARRKTYELLPMTPDEAILQMELLSHSFYVFLDMDRNQASVVYKRNDGKYGLLETTH